jgi:hypothetical protein
MTDLIKFPKELENEPFMKIYRECGKVIEEAIRLRLEQLFIARHYSDMPYFDGLMTCYTDKIAFFRKEACRLNHESMRELERECSGLDDPEFSAEIVKLRGSINEDYLNITQYSEKTAIN